MSGQECCCSQGRSGAAARVAEVSGWAASGALLVLMPKCPACLAGYVLLFTGVGLSFPAATAVRWSLIGLCVAIMVALGARTVLRAVRGGVR